MWVWFCTVCQPHSAMFYMAYLYTRSDMLHSYGCIDSSVLYSYNATGVLPSFCYLFVSHAMYCIKFEQTLPSKNKNLYWDYSLQYPLPPKKRCFKCKINLKLMPISFAVVVVVQQENWYLFSRGRPWHWSRYWRTTDQQRNIQTANLNMWCTSLHMLKNLWRILEARILKIL